VADVIARWRPARSAFRHGRRGTWAGRIARLCSQLKRRLSSDVKRAAATGRQEKKEEHGLAGAVRASRE